MPENDLGSVEKEPAPSKGEAFDNGTRFGMDLIAAAAVGVGAGLLLDHWLGTAPWMTLIFSILGLAVGLRNFYELARKLLRPNPPNDPPPTP